MAKQPTKKQIEEWREKAERWDNLGKKIDSFYFDKDGNEIPEDEGDGLISIGEAAAYAFGYMA